MDEGEAWVLGDNLRGESVTLFSHLVGVPWVQPFHWLLFERWTLSGSGLFSSWVFVVMSGSVRREHDLAGQSLQKVQLHIWPRALKGMRSTHTFCYTACHTPPHMLPSCHTDLFSHFQTFNPSLLASWVYKIQKSPPYFLDTVPCEASVPMTPKQKQPIEARIQKSSQKQGKFTLQQSS